MSLDSTQILAKLQAEPAPLSYAKLKKEFAGKKSGNSEADLRAALSNEKIFAWPKKSYWHVDPVAHLGTEILRLCGQKALKKNEIKVKARSSKDVAGALERLLADRKLLKIGALAGATVLFVSMDSPRAAYEAYAHELIEKQLTKAGIEEAALEEKIWDILPKLEPEKDVPVSTSRVRSALGLMEAGKRRFDEAALKLREQRRVYLSQHDHPLGLSAEDRDWLIDAKDGRYYVAITRREQ